LSSFKSINSEKADSKNSYEESSNDSNKNPLVLTPDNILHKSNFHYNSSEELYKDILKLKNYSDNVTLYLGTIDNPIFGKVQQIITHINEHNINMEFDENYDPDALERPLTDREKNNNLNNEEKKKTTPQSLQNLKYASLTVLILLIVYTIIEFTFNSNTNESIKNTFSMIYFSYSSINEIVWSSYLLKSVILANVFDIYYNKTMTKTQFVDENLNQLLVSINTLKYTISNITQSKLELPIDHSNMLKTDMIKFYYFDLDGNMITQYNSLVDILTQVKFY